MTTNIGETELDNMSEEELDKILTEQEQGVETDVETEDVKEESDQTPKDTEPVTESEDTESETEEQVEEDVLSGEDVPEHYKGKSAKELLEMQQNANKKISQLSNQMHRAAEQLKAAEERLAQYESKVHQDNQSDLLKKYEKDDVEAIRKILKYEMQEMEMEKRNVAAQEAELVKSEHDQIWEQLETFNPQLFYKIKDEALEVMSNDVENTYQKKGWLKSFIASKAREGLETPESRKQQDKTAVKRRAVTVTSSGRNSTSPRTTKLVDDMSPDEYLEHMKAQGVTI